MSCVLNQNCTYIAGNLNLSPWTGFGVLILFIVVIQNAVFGYFVGQARKKYNVPYPNLYAFPGQKMVYGPMVVSPPTEVEMPEPEASPVISENDAYTFNCVQRAHQNYLENLPPFLFLLGVGTLSFPLVAGWAGVIWVIGKSVYFYGYTQKAESRVWGAVSYIGLVALLVVDLVFAAYLFQKTLPY